MAIGASIEHEGVYAEPIEDATVTTAEETSTVFGINAYVINDGAADITFNIYLKDPSSGTYASKAFVLKVGEKNTVPFRFDRMGWQTSSGTSAFRMFAYRPGR